VDRDFIIKGIETGKPEYREGAIWGNPYLRILRRQLEEYITAELGIEYLVKVKNELELRKIKKEIADLKTRLATLQIRKAEIEGSLGK
jgi:hypothetical protein